MKIRVFREEELISKGCFMMTMLNGQNGDARVMFYDPEEEVKSEEDYLVLTEEERIDFQCRAWECYYEDELHSLPGNTLIVSDDEIAEEAEWIYLGVSIGTVCVPNIEGITYECIF